VTTINTSNLHLFNENGIMTKYTNAENILNEYSITRLKYYQLRKEYLLSEWTIELDKVIEKIRFITYINDISHELKLANKKRIEIEHIMIKHKFIKISNSYDYLIKMPIYSLSLDKIEKLEIKKEELIAKIKVLSDKSPKILWLDDLSELKSELVNFSNNWNDNN
jgi:DNA topoisomerase-2